MYWSWVKSGIALGVVFFLATVLVKPIGVSTQFVIFDGVIMNQLSDTFIAEDADAKFGYTSSNPYFNKSGGKYAKAAANPINYGFIFVIAMLAGGFIARVVERRGDSEKNTPREQVPGYHLRRFGAGGTKRFLLAFLGGAIVLFGARLAGGCTSGHMMSGIMQTAVSGYLFAAAAFLAAIPTAIFVYKR